MKYFSFSVTIRNIYLFHDTYHTIIRKHSLSSLCSVEVMIILILIAVVPLFVSPSTFVTIILSCCRRRHKRCHHRRHKRCRCRRHKLCHRRRHKPCHRRCHKFVNRRRNKYCLRRRHKLSHRRRHKHCHRRRHKLVNRRRNK